MPNLTMLFLEDNQISICDINFLHMPKLVSLNLNSNKFVSHPRAESVNPTDVVRFVSLISQFDDGASKRAGKPLDQVHDLGEQ